MFSHGIYSLSTKKVPRQMHYGINLVFIILNIVKWPTMDASYHDWIDLRRCSNAWNYGKK